MCYSKNTPVLFSFPFLFFPWYITNQQFFASVKVIGELFSKQQGWKNAQFLWTTVTKFSDIFVRKRPKYPYKWSIFPQNCKYFPPKAKFSGKEIPKFCIFSMHQLAAIYLKDLSFFLYRWQARQRDPPIRERLLRAATSSEADRDRPGAASQRGDPGQGGRRRPQDCPICRLWECWNGGVPGGPARKALFHRGECQAAGGTYYNRGNYWVS